GTTHLTHMLALKGKHATPVLTYRAHLICFLRDSVPPWFDPPKILPDLPQILKFRNFPRGTL
ncbi:MAG: hypothetical protein ACF8PG_10825, partial [Maioricimonas sp. JB045]